MGVVNQGSLWGSKKSYGPCHKNAHITKTLHAILRCLEVFWNLSVDPLNLWISGSEDGVLIPSFGTATWDPVTTLNY